MSDDQTTIPDWIERMSLNEVRAMAAQEFPNASFRLLGGGEFWFSDLIAAAKARESANGKA